MPDYRRYRVPGATYFFTVNLLDRCSDLLLAHIDSLRGAVRRVRGRRPFHIDAWVVLPDHMHCLWTLPDDDWDYPSRWRDIKAAFAKSLPAMGAALTGHDPPRRARHLAAAILGAHDQG
jgi:putative transposase